MKTYEKQDLCLRCMSPLNGAARCPKCGFDTADYQPEEHHLKPRTILHGQYIIGCVLGEGGFGITYVGWDLLLHMMVAIKEYFPVGVVMRDSTMENTVCVFSGADEEFFRHDRSKFIHEAQKLAKFDDNPGVVSVKNYFMENGTAYIVMEYIQGINLGVFTQKNGGKLDINQTLKLLDLPIRTLSQLHKANTYHRDISPENLMVTNAGNVKMIDFGSAMDSNVDTKTRMLKVRPGYSPIELYTTAGKEGGYTDIYAICATIYKTITGVVPPMATERVVEDKLIPPSRLGVKNILPRQEKALMKGLSVNSASRYQNIEDLYRDLKVEQKKSPVKKLAILLAVLVALGSGSYMAISGMQKARTVDFASPDFQMMVESALELEQGAMIKPDQLSDITTIYVKGNQIFFESPGSNLLYQTYTDARSVSLEDLQDFPALRTLYLCVEGYSAEDVAHISKLTGLTHLTLISDDLTSLDMIAPLTNLEVLQIRGAKFNDISPLSGLVNLQELYISHSLVSDLSPLSGLEKLASLTAHQNKIEDWSPVEHVDRVTGRDDQNIELAFQSAEFRDMLRKALNLSANAPIYANDLKGITDVAIINNVMYLNEEVDLNRDVVNAVSEIPLDDLTLFTNLTTLRLGIEGYSSNSLRVLEALPQLKGLAIVDSTIDSIAPIASLENLGWLQLESDAITDISALSGLTRLYHLNLICEQVADVSPLASLTHLQELMLDCRRVTGLETLADLTYLRDVTIYSSAISEIPRLPNIEALRLELDDLTMIDWTVTQDMRAKVYLWEGGRWVELDLTPVKFVSTELEAMFRQELGFSEDSIIVQANLDGIEQLTLAENRLSFSLEDISDVDGMISVAPLPLDDLARLRNLERLNLGVEGYSSEALEVLRSMPSVRELCISGHSITSLDAVSALPYLTEFHYWGDGATDFSFLNSATNLQILGLSCKNLTDIEFVSSMTRLRELDIHGCSVSSIEPVRSCAQLRKLSAEGNAIVDWSPADHVAMVNGKENQKFVVEFSSSEFEAMVRNAIGVPAGEPVFTYHLESFQFVMLMDNHLFLGNFYEEMPEIVLDQLVPVSEVPLDDLKLFPNLHTLNLGIEGYSSEALGVLSELTGVTDLRIWSNSIDSIEFVRNMPQLTSFVYTGGGVSDFEPLRSLTGLNHLSISHNEHLINVDFCEGMTQLREVAFSYTNLTSLEGLRNAQNLTDLHVQHNMIADFGPVAHVPNIHSMYEQRVTFASPEFEAMVKSSLGIPSDNPVLRSHLLSITHASMVNNELICLFNNEGVLADLNSGLAMQVEPIPLGDFALFENLHWLEICAEGYTAENLAALSGMPSLQFFKVISNTLDSLEFLHAMPESMTGFEYDGIGVTDFEPIRARRLNGLYLFNNPNLANLDFLSDMHSLYSLTVYNCALENIEGLRGLEDLQDIELGYNYISDFSPINHIGNVPGADLQRIRFSDPEFEAMMRRALGTPEHEAVYNGQLWPITEAAIVNGEIRLYSGREGEEHPSGSLDELVSTREFSLDDLNCMPNLQTLWICADGWSSEAFATLPHLGVLHEFYIVSNTLDSLEFLNTPGFADRMPMLGIFNYHGGAVTGFEPMRDILPRVYGASIVNNPNLTGLEIFRGMHNLSHLWLHNCGIESIEALREFENLQFVDLTGNRITDFSPVAHVPEVGGMNMQAIELEFASKTFRRMVTDALGMDEDDPVHMFDLAGITRVTLYNNELHFNMYQYSGDDMWFDQYEPAEEVPLGDLCLFPDLQTVHLNVRGYTDKAFEGLENLAACTPLREVYISGGHQHETAPEDFTLSFLSSLNGIEKLHISAPALPSLDHIAGLTSLRSLTAIHCYNVSSIEAVRDMTGLEYLQLNTNGVTDLSPLAGLDKVIELNLNDDAICDIRPLSEMDSMRRLYLRGGMGLTSLEPLRDRYFERIDIGNVCVADWSPLKNYYPEYQNPEVIGFSSQEFKMALCEALGLPPVKPIYNTQLATIDNMTIANGRISTNFDWDDRFWNYNAPSKDEYGKAFPLEDLRHFQGLYSLILYLPYNESASLYPLSSLKNLSQLVLWGDRITDVGILDDLNNVHWLSLGGKNIEDISPLSGIIRLDYLQLVDSKVTDLSPLHHLPYLNHVQLFNNEDLREKHLEPIEHVNNVEFSRD